MSLLDTITGGADANASAAETAGLNTLEQINAPTTAQLTIPQLQQYVAAGVMTPAQAQAYLVNNNAYNQVQLDPQSLAAEQQALSQLQGIATPGGPDAEAQLAEQQAANAANQTLQGQEGANVLQAEQRGVAPQLATMAANEQDIGNNAGALFSADQQAAANEEARQLAALSGVGTQASAIQGQTSQLATNKANAANAINQFNAQNQQANSQYNATNQQAANQYNAQNTQNVSNQNTQQGNAATIYNSTVAPETAFNNALQKGEAEEGAEGNIANQQMAEGQQSAGLLGALIGGGAQVGAAAAGAAHGGEIDMKAGGVVPGKPVVPGDSPVNDIIPAHVGPKPIKLSPGEVVVPRSLATQPDPARIAQFLRSMPRFNRQAQPPAAHPHDIAKVLQALAAMRGGNHNAI